MINQKYHEATHEQNQLAIHQILHSHYNRLEDIAAVLKIQAGVLERMLQRIEEASGMPKGRPLPIVQASPVQNQQYPSTAVDINGVAQGFLLCGPGNVSLYKKSPNILGGQLLMGTLPSNGSPVFYPFYDRAHVGDTYAVATDSTGATLLSMTTWLEPIGLSGQQLYMMGQS